MCLHRGGIVSVRLAALNSHAPSVDLDRSLRYTSVMEDGHYRC